MLMYHWIIKIVISVMGLTLGQILRVYYPDLSENNTWFILCYPCNTALQLASPHRTSEHTELLPEYSSNIAHFGLKVKKYFCIIFICGYWNRTNIAGVKIRRATNYTKPHYNWIRQIYHIVLCMSTLLFTILLFLWVYLVDHRI